MSTPKIREALLTQGEASPVDSELKTWNALIQADERRSRRLTRATIAVWIAWIVCVTMMFALPRILARSGSAPTPQPPSVLVSTMTLALSVAVGMGAVFLPVMGVVLLVLAVFSRRATDISQLRASVAAIDTQLKALLASRADEESPAKPQS
jgi:hypothetical protein